MFKDQLKLLPNSNLNGLLLFVISVIALALLGPIKLFSGSDVPLTLQSLLVVLFPVMFGWQIGGAAVLSYLILGAIGVPVFVDYNSGFKAFLGPTGGFLIAFLAAAVSSGYIAEMKFSSPRMKAIIALFVGHGLILLLGLTWLWRIMPEEDKLGRMIDFFGPATLLKIALSFLIIQLILRMRPTIASTPRS